MRCSACRFKGNIGMKMCCKLTNREINSGMICSMTDDELRSVLDDLMREKSRRMLYKNVRGVENGKDSGS